jgi:hypothetical protein
MDAAALVAFLAACASQFWDMSKRAPCSTAIAAFDDGRVHRKFHVRGLSK